MHERLVAVVLTKHPVRVHAGKTRLHVMHSRSYSVSFSLAAVRVARGGGLAWGRFSQKHAKYPAGSADMRDTRKERKAEFRKVIQPARLDLAALMVISNRKLLLRRHNPSLARRQARDVYTHTRTKEAEICTDIRRLSHKSLSVCIFYDYFFNARIQR